MPNTPHHIQILKLLQHQTLLRAKELDRLGIPRAVLSRLLKAGRIERVEHGLYRIPDNTGSEDDSLTIVAARVPQAVFCLLTALQFHQLTTQLPRQLWIAMPRGSHPPRLDYPPLKMVQMVDAAYAAHVEVHEQAGVSIRVYSAAKTVADCFKYRNTIGVDVAMEALKDAWSRNKASSAELWECAVICRVANVMRPYLEAIVHD